MDLSVVKTALESKSYDKIADICDNLMLQVTSFTLTVIILRVFFFVCISLLT